MRSKSSFKFEFSRESEDEGVQLSSRILHLKLGSPMVLAIAMLLLGLSALGYAFSLDLHTTDEETHLQIETESATEDPPTSSSLLRSSRSHRARKAPRTARIEQP